MKADVRLLADREDARVYIAAAGGAALLAVQILALADASLAAKYAAFKRKLADDVAARDAALQKKLNS